MAPVKKRHKPKRKKRFIENNDIFQQDQYFSFQYQYQSICVGSIAPNPEQPRHQFDIGKLKENVSQRGVLQPVIVKKSTDNNGNGEEYILIDGERRWRAAKDANRDEIPAIVISSDVQPAQLAELAINLNMQRKNLTALEEAESLKKLQDDYGFTQEELANITGKSRSYLNEIIAITKLPERIKFEIRRNSDIKCSRHFLLNLVKEKAEDKILELWEEKRKGIPKEVKKDSKEREKSDPPFDGEYKSPSPENDFCLILQYKEDRLNSLQEGSLKAAFDKILQNLGMNCSVSFTEN